MQRDNFPNMETMDSVAKLRSQNVPEEHINTAMEVFGQFLDAIDPQR